jgi:hypothetical protein
MPKPSARNWPLLTVLLFNAVFLAGILFTLLWMAATESSRNARPEAYALLSISPRPQRHLAGQQAPPVGLAELRDFGRLQQAHFRSRLVLVGALRNPAVGALPIVRKQKDPIAWLEKHVRAEFPDTPATLRVALNAGTLKEQAAIINALVSAHLDHADQENRSEKLRQSNWLKLLSARFAAFQKDLKWDTLRTIEDLLLSASALGSGKEPALRELKNLHADLFQLKAQIQKGEGELALLKQAKDGEPEHVEPTIERAFDEERGLPQLLDRAVTLTTRLTKLNEHDGGVEILVASKRALADWELRKCVRAAKVQQLHRDAASLLSLAAEGLEGAGRTRLEKKAWLLEAQAGALGKAIAPRAAQPCDLKPADVDQKIVRDVVARGQVFARLVAAAKRRPAPGVVAPLRVTLLVKAVAAP